MKNQSVKYENKYLSDVAKGIRNKKQKRLLCDELQSHILDKADYYEEIGYTKEEALKKATEDMGNPNDVVIPMNNLHYSDWYEDPLSLDSIILLTIQAILLFFYSKKLIYAEYGAVHYVYKDFTSLLILGFNLYVIYRARKEKNRHVLVLESISLVFQFFFNPYQPLFYGVASFFDSYASNYSDYIFSYRFIADRTFDILNVASIILVCIMLCYCIVTVVLINLQEKGKKLIIQWQIIKVIGITALIIFGVNFTYMTASTLVAYTQKDVKAEESEKLQLSLIEYFSEIELLKDKYTIDDMKSDLANREVFKEYGTDVNEVFFTHIKERYSVQGNWLIGQWGDDYWDFEALVKYDHEYKINGLTYGYVWDFYDEDHIYIGDMVVVFDYYEEYEEYNQIYIVPSVFYDYNYEPSESDFYLYKAETFFDTINPNNPYCCREDFDFIGKKMTMDEFLESDLADKAVNITITKNNIFFEFKIENGDVKSVVFNKKSGVFKKFEYDDPNDSVSVPW